MRFNPWWFSGREQLLQQFFRQFQATLGKPDVPGKLKGVSERVGDFVKLLTPLKYAKYIPGVGGLAGMPADILETVAETLGTAAEALERDIFEIRRAIDTALVEQETRILVVIDDIDRVRAEEIQQLFQLVKAVADFPKTIYLLSFDRQVVIDALKDFQGPAGQDYLEKIVQAPFDLPLPDRDSLRNLLEAQLDEVLGGTPGDLFDQTELSNLYWDGVDAFIRTPRDIKRFINALRIAYPVVRGEVHAVDFLGIESLRVFSPLVYAFVATRKTLFAGSSDLRAGIGDTPEERRRLFDLLLNAVPGPQQQAVKGILGRLFPRWDTAYGGMTHGASWLDAWRRARRICSPDVFDVYFRLALTPGDIGATEMREMLDVASQPEVFGGRLLQLAEQRRADGATRLRAFLYRLDDFIEDVPVADIEPLLQALYHVGDDLLWRAEEEQQGLFDRSTDHWLLRISGRLVHRLPTQRERFALLTRC